MRTLIFILLLFFSSITLAEHLNHKAHIKCYSNGKLIYQGDTKDIYYIDEKSFVFKDNNKDRDMFIWASECVIEA